jgi:4-hydroxybutyrate CoA-transferase
MFEMQPVDYVNNPQIIAQNYKMTAINAALQVDLYGNVYCDVLGLEQFTGSGGQLDYVRGCDLNPEAKFINTLPSISTDQKWSRIVVHPSMTDNPLAPQMPLFTRYSADIVVTENGVAYLRGKTSRERAEALIAIAHPKFRDSLQEQAEEVGLLEK